MYERSLLFIRSCDSSHLYLDKKTINITNRFDSSENFQVLFFYI